jgi:hypothetical protein
MRARTTLVVAAMAIFAAAGCGKHKKAQAPRPPVAFAGSYALSCRNIVTLDGGFVAAECANLKGHFDVSYIHAAACKGGISNIDGVLTCNGAVATTTLPASISGSDTAISGDAASSTPPSKP